MGNGMVTLVDHPSIWRIHSVWRKWRTYRLRRCEPCERKLSCTVLRGEGARKGSDLSDTVGKHNNENVIQEYVKNHGKQDEHKQVGYVNILNEDNPLLAVGSFV